MVGHSWYCMQAAFDLLVAGARLLAASDMQQACQLLSLVTTLEETASQRLLCWLLPQQRSEASHCYERWVTIAGISRSNQVCAVVTMDLLTDWQQYVQLTACDSARASRRLPQGIWCLQVSTVRQRLAAACSDGAGAARAHLVARQGFAMLLKALAGLSTAATLASGSQHASEQPDNLAHALQQAASCLKGAQSHNLRSEPIAGHDMLAVLMVELHDDRGVVEATLRPFLTA